MARATKKKKNIRKPSPRRSGTMGFAAVLGVIIALAVGLIVFTKSGNESVASGVGPDIGDHHHAALGVNICGQWKPNTPQYESANGLHSHGDGFIHMHPYSRAGANDNATVGLYLKQADESVTNDSLKLSDGTEMENGDKCENLDNKEGKIRWSVNGEERTGNPANYVPNDLDVIAIAFLPEGEEIGTPPSAGQAPSDVGAPQTPVPTAPGSADPSQTPDGTTDTTAPGTTATTSG